MEESFVFTFLIHSHKKWKNSLETGAKLLFSLELEISGWPCREYIKTAKNSGFCEKLLSENDFETVLSTFGCYDYGTNASEVVQKTATNQKEYHKCSLCLMVC